MKIIIWDMEVFKYNTLLGAIVLEGNERKIYQTWDLNQIKNFYEEHKNDIWVGHNSQEYDSLILQSILDNSDPYLRSKEIITNNLRYKSYIPKYQYDIMKEHFGSLKSIEAAFGKNISES